jgi:hypothetical protein
LNKDVVAYEGFEIRFKDNELVNQTNPWKAAGSVHRKEPHEWVGQKSTQEFIEQNQTETKGSISTLLKVTPGKGGGSFAHWKLGLAYTAFLNPKLHSWFMDIVKERFEEMVNPDLIIAAAPPTAFGIRWIGI